MMVEKTRVKAFKNAFIYVQLLLERGMQKEIDIFYEFNGRNTIIRTSYRLTNFQHKEMLVE